MNSNNKKFLAVITVPVIFFITFGIYSILVRVLNLPTLNEFIAKLDILFGKYGYWMVLAGAIGEGLLFLNWYLPGSVIVVFGVVFAKTGPLSPVLVVFFIIIGFFITSLLNYALGKYGWYKLFLKFGLEKSINNVKEKLEKSGSSIIFSTFFHPNVGALTSASAGIIHYPFKKFFYQALLATTMWNILWGVVVYFSGPVILRLLSTTTILLVLLVWIIVLGYKHYKHKESSGEEHINVP